VADVDLYDALLGVLDALIQFGAEVPAADAQRLYPQFPVQSLILLSRSQENPAPALLEMFQAEQIRPTAWLAAGDILLQRRAEGFATAVLAGLTVHAQVDVYESGVGGSFGGGNLCCMAGGPFRSRIGWPPLGVYAFSGCGIRLQPGATLLADGPDPVHYHRQVNGSYHADGVTGCACGEDRDLVYQHYLTALLFHPPEEPPLRAHVSHLIEWQGPDAYSSELAAFIAAQQRVFAELARQLGNLRLVSETEAATLRPRLQIRISDYRASPARALPALAPLPENVTVEP
jgi:hypothetical protein